MTTPPRRGSQPALPAPAEQVPEDVFIRTWVEAESKMPRALLSVTQVRSGYVATARPPDIYSAVDESPVLALRRLIDLLEA